MKRGKGRNMKRTAIGLLAVVVMASILTVVPHTPAGAAVTVQGPTKMAPVTGNWVSPTTGKPMTDAQVQRLVNQSNRSYAAAHPNAPGAASIQWGWGTVLLELSHSDLQSALVQMFFAGLIAQALYICGWIPGVVLTLACIGAIAALGVGLTNAMASAYNYTQYGSGWMWWCQSLNPNAYCPGGQYDPAFGLWYGTWSYQDSGLNILFTWLGTPIAVERNDYCGCGF